MCVPDFWKLNHILNRLGDFCWNEAAPRGSCICACECTFESDNCKLCKIINFQLTICGPHRALLFSALPALGVILCLSCNPASLLPASSSSALSSSPLRRFSLVPFQVHVHVLAAALCTRKQRSTWPTELDTHRTKETGLQSRAAASHSGASGSKTENVKFCNLLPESCFCQWLFGCFASAAAHTHTHRGGHSATGKLRGAGGRGLGRGESFVTHCVWICGPVCVSCTVVA